MTTILLPPGPRSVFPGRQILAMRRSPVHFLAELASRYGDVVALRFGRRSVYLLNHPELAHELLVVQQRNLRKGDALQKARRLLGNGLLTNEGEPHLRQRRMLQPAFHRERITGYGQVMASYATRHAVAWQDGSTIDAAEEMMRLTLAIVGKTLFNTDVETDAGTVGHALTEIMQSFGLLMLPFGDLIERLPLPRIRRMHAARDQLDTLIRRMIEQRRTQGDQGDLLSMLLLAHDGEAEPDALADQQIRDEAMTLFLAGHETTANGLAWAWYAIAQHPEVEAKLHAELDQVLAGRTPTPEDCERLPYTRAVFSETLRLYPPAWAIGRQAVQDMTIAGYRIPAGSTLLVSPWLFHRDPRFFADPLSFRPERWLDGSQAERPKLAYLPFGAGSRMCIGESFAWMEGVLLIATIAQRWRLQLAPGTTIEPQPLATLRPRGGVPVTLVQRFR